MITYGAFGRNATHIAKVIHHNGVRVWPGPNAPGRNNMIARPNGTNASTVFHNMNGRTVPASS